MKKNVLVYPCGTEIGLEIYRSTKNSIHYNVIGGSSTYDHGRFVFENHIDNLPFITDNSDEAEIKKFNEIIKSHKIDFIFPAMDGVIYKFAEYKHLFDGKVICSDFETLKITRSKQNTYKFFQDKLLTPKLYKGIEDVEQYPVFIKPDVGQGSVGARKIKNKEELSFYLSETDKKMLIMENLPKDEYTVDCFTNNSGELIFAQGRKRKRIKGGISVNAIKTDDERFLQIAKIINQNLKHKGGWFFQVKERENKELVIMEIGSRIAGASGHCRAYGVNLSLATIFLFDGNEIDSFIQNDYEIELDRALMNTFKIDLKYEHVYIDYDDTILIDDKINTQIISFLFQCLNKKCPITLITRHKKNIQEELQKRCIDKIFSEIIHLQNGEEKYNYIKNKNAIFIDDSYGERLKIKKNINIPTFDTHMIGALLDDGEQ